MQQQNTIKTAKQLSIIYSRLHILLNFCTSLAQRGKTPVTSCWTLQCLSSETPSKINTKQQTHVSVSGS